MKLVYFTICARNYLAYALTLRDSLLRAQPGADFRIFLADAALDGEAPVPGVTAIADIALPDRDDMAMRYDVMEFATAVKPFCFAHLFDRDGAEAAIYLDPDILVLAPPDAVTQALAEGAQAVLTPHLTAPLPNDGLKPDTLDIERSGVFNLGFAAFANRPDARRFLDWWGGRCAKECFADVARGLFVDQKFAEQAPEFIAETTVLRDPGYNVAYWNLAHRPLARADDGGWTAGGARLRFFHFSGVVPGDASVFSKHQNRFAPADLGEGRALLDEYHARLDAAGHTRYAKIPYAYGQYSDGVAIPRPARRLYAQWRDAGEEARPFAAVYHRLNTPAPGIAQAPAPITVLMAEIWRERPDLQALFALSTRAGRAGFSRWFLLNGAREYGLDPVFTAPAESGGAGVKAKAARALWRALPEGLRARLKRAP